MLGLEHQLDCIDYTKKNFVHADMSPEEFNKSMTERGESFMQMFLKMMGQSMAQQKSVLFRVGDLSSGAHFFQSSLSRSAMTGSYSRAPSLAVSSALSGW